LSKVCFRKYEKLKQEHENFLAQQRRLEEVKKELPKLKTAIIKVFSTPL